jgi:hypothetical protein
MSIATKGVWFATSPYRLTAKDVSQETTQKPFPQGFLRMSDAYHRLYSGMWGGLAAPAPVQACKANFKLSTRFAGWQSRAALSLTAAALDGKFRVYTVADPKLAPSIDEPKAPPPPTKDPTVIPISALRRLIIWRDMLPDRAIRPTIKTTSDDLNLFVLLRIGMLVVQEREFKRWYRSEKSKGKWPSQRTRSKRGRGRPTKQTEPLRKAVLALVEEQTWSGKDGIAKLRRLLIEDSRLKAVPSPDTLERFIGRLYIETGNPALFKKPRLKKRAKSTLPQNSSDNPEC